MAPTQRDIIYPKNTGLVRIGMDGPATAGS
jgi:hypothetical protein